MSYYIYTVSQDVTRCDFKTQPSLKRNRDGKEVLDSPNCTNKCASLRYYENQLLYNAGALLPTSHAINYDDVELRADEGRP